MQLHVLLVAGVTLALAGPLFGRDSGGSFGTTLVLTGKAPGRGDGFFAADTHRWDGSLTELMALPGASGLQLASLEVQRRGDGVVLEWTNSAWTLQGGPSPGGSFTDLPQATSPYAPAVSSPQQFFRLVSNYRRGRSHPLPPMGYMSWYQGGAQGGVTESLMRARMHALVTNGWRDAGYRYLNIDAGWATSNRIDGKITWDTNRFTSIPKLVADAHALGLKVGIYVEPARTPEHHWVTSVGHFKEDAQTFADWGIDYIKFDPRSPFKAQEYIQDFVSAVDATGRPMFVHSYMQTAPEGWAPVFLNSFRKGLDIAGPTVEMLWGQFMSNFNGIVNYVGYVRPGFYVDMETISLSMGYPWGKVEWQRGILSMHAILAAPIFLNTANDPERFPTEKMAQDADFIRIHQDPGVCAPFMVYTNLQAMIWVRPLGNVTSGTNAVAMWNSDIYDPRQLTLTAEHLGLPEGSRFLIRDVWHKTNFVATGAYTRDVLPGSAALLKVVSGP